MDILVTEEQLDMMLSSYWKKIFEDAYYLESYRTDYDNKEWSGLVKPSKDGGFQTLVVRPIEDGEDERWYTNGLFFGDKNVLFDIPISEFYNSLRRFLNKTYGTQIESLM